MIQSQIGVSYKSKSMEWNLRLRVVSSVRSSIRLEAPHKEERDEGALNEGAVGVGKSVAII